MEAPSSFELGKRDAAILVRGDGDIELLVPGFEDDEQVPEDILILSAFLIGFRKPEFREHMLDLLETYRAA